MQNKTLANIEISNPDKIIYKKDKITKIDIANYYNNIAKRMLPYLNKRLLSVIRCHNGVNDSCFFKKHPVESSNVENFLVDNQEYFYVKNKQQLIYQVQYGTIEFHTWGSKITNINKPDIMVFDLDPDKNLPIEKLQTGVLCLKKILDKLHLKSFLKTSGGKGYHVVIPFTYCKNWDKFNNFAKQIANLMEQQYPQLFTTNIRKIERKGKIFIDWLRNSKGATCVTPYSLRAKNDATISMPIGWKNLKKVTPQQVNIKNYKSYLNTSWRNFFKVEQSIK